MHRRQDVAAEVKKMAQDWGLIGQDAAAPGQPVEGGPLVVRIKPKPEPDLSNPLPGAAARGSKDPTDPDSVANLIRQLERARDVAEAQLQTVEMSSTEAAKALALAKAEAAAREDVEKGTRDFRRVIEVRMIISS